MRKNRYARLPLLRHFSEDIPSLTRASTTVGPTFVLRDVAVGICQHLGYSCDYLTNSRSIPDAILHYQKAHEATNSDSLIGQIQLADLMSGNTKSSGVWTTYILGRDNFKFLVLARMHQARDILSFNCIQLSEGKRQGENFKIEFSITTEQERLNYTTFPVALANVKDVGLAPPMQISIKTLKQKRFQERNLLMKVRILSVFNDKNIVASSSSLSSYNRFPHTESRGTLERSRSEGSKSTVKCSSCDMKIEGSFYCCIQCGHYGLCGQCRNMKMKSSHRLTEIQNPEEILTFIQSVYGKYMDSVWNRKTLP